MLDLDQGGSTLSADADPNRVGDPAPNTGNAAAHRADAARGRSPDAVFTFSYVSWDAAARRGWFATEDRLARSLVGHERIGQVLVCDLPRSLPLKLVRDCLSRDRVSFPFSESARLLRPVRLRRNYPTAISAVERACAAYERAIARTARSMGLQAPAVITANPLIAGFGKFDWAGPVTFFAIDDWLAYPPHRRWWPAYEESFARVRARGRRVCAVSAAALERIAPTGPSAVVPNGLDPAEWLGPPAPLPAWASELGRPTAVYAGTLDSRLDVRALIEAAGELPEVSFVLVGPLLEPAHLAPLRGRANVVIRPPLPRAQVTSLIRGADVGIIPHRVSDLTQAMSPLKLYEYLAAGLPVAATDLAPIRSVNSSVTLVGPDDKFFAAVRSALQRGRAAEVARTSFVSRNSWRARHDALLDLALA